MSALPGKRGLRWLLLVSASLSAIAVFLLATATANTALFAQGYDVLLIGNIVLIGLLMLVFYIPAGFYMDLFLWRRRERQRIRTKSKG